MQFGSAGVLVWFGFILLARRKRAIPFTGVFFFGIKKNNAYVSHTNQKTTAAKPCWKKVF